MHQPREQGTGQTHPRRDRRPVQQLAGADLAVGDQLGERQGDACRDIQADIDNIRRAWRWAVEDGQAGLLRDALRPMSLFADLREGKTTYPLILGLEREPQPGRSQAGLVGARTLVALAIETVDPQGQMPGYQTA